MKKILLALTVVFSIFVLSACGLSEYDETPDTVDDPDPDSDQEEEADDDPLRVGMSLKYPPFETEENGEPYGISVDIAHALGAYLDRDVEILDTDFGSLIPSLNSGEIDIIIGSMSITEEREQSVDFSDPYFYFKIISLVNQDFADANSITEDSTTEDLTSVDGVKFVGIANQVSYQIPKDMELDTTEATDLSTAVYDVVQGSRDVLMMSANPVVNNHMSNEDQTMVVWDPFISSPIGMAVREGDEALLADANAFIDQMDEEGGLYDTLRDDWDSDIEDRLVRYGLEFYINED